MTAQFVLHFASRFFGFDLVGRRLAARNAATQFAPGLRELAYLRRIFVRTRADAQLDFSPSTKPYDERLETHEPTVLLASRPMPLASTNLPAR